MPRESTPSKPLYVLILEDRQEDAELELRELRKAGYEPDWKRVETAADFLASLASEPDIILADYQLPRFDGLRALQLLKEKGRDIPFILVSGTVGEELAVEAMKQGATDYLLKDRMMRLGQAVAQALEMKRLRLEKQHAEQIIHEGEERYRELVELSNDTIYVAIEGRFAFINPAGLKLFGATDVSQLLGKHVLELIHPDYTKKVTERMSLVYDDRKEAPLQESRFLRLDGSAVDVEVTAKPYDYWGRSGALVNARDVTDRKKAEEALRQARGFAEKVIQTANVIFLQLDSSGKVIRINSAAEEITGYDRLEVEGTNWFDALVPKDRFPVVWKVFQQMRMDGTLPDVFENPIVTKDGELRQIMWKNNVLVEEGKTIGSISFGLDVTELKKSAEALRKSEERLRLTLDATSVVAWELDLTTDKIEESGPVGSVFGKPLGFRHPDSKSFAENLHPDDRNRVFDDLEKARDSHSTFSTEYRVVSDRGDARWVSANGKVLDDADGRPSRVLGIARDITASKQAEEQIKASLHEKEVLLREIHHRVKNNLQIISSLLNLQASRMKDEESRFALADSQHRVRSMALIHESLYRSENLARVDFAQYLEAVTKELVRGISKGSVSVSWELSPVFLPIDTAIPCGLIVNELVTNALKHAFTEGNEGMIKIALRQRDPLMIELSVSDNGKGFSPQTDLRSFQSMGMSLIHDLTGQIGGTVAFTGDSGTTFKITFPINQE